MQEKIAHSSVNHKQSAFSLTAIQITGATSLPILNSSIQLYHQYGFGGALTVLFLGNAFIWLIALIIVWMSQSTIKNTLENAGDYVGHVGSYLVGFVLIASTIAWFIMQTNLASEIILNLIPLEKNLNVNTFIQVGVGLSILSTLASMEGIKGIRICASLSFPILLFAFIAFIFLVPSFGPTTQKIQSSIGSLAIALGTSLSVAVDYPTFFQHSKSKKQSFLAVSAIQIITFLMGIGGLFLGEFITSTTDLSAWDVIFNSIIPVKVVFFILVVLSCICVNMVNVYSASIAWELIVPILAGRKEYIILGLGLTFAFVLTTNLLPIEQLLVATDISLSNLCLVLVFGYLCKMYIFSEIKMIDKLIYLIGWIIGCVILVISESKSNISIYLLISGFAISSFVVIFTAITRRMVASLKQF